VELPGYLGDAQAGGAQQEDGRRGPTSPDILRQSGIDCQPMLTIMALAKRIAKIISERF